MQLKHIEHPEDSILTGDLSALNWFTTKSKISLKIDGTPSIVWGTNPESGKFFVGTKSVFNKIKKKINESIEDIERNHPDKDLQDKLKACFHNLPRTGKIYQGDFIGFGGDDWYKPNTIGYLFPHKINHNIIVAPHTVYDVWGNTLLDTVAKPLEHTLFSNFDDVLFVQCNSQYNITNEIKHFSDFAKQMAQMVDFVTVAKSNTIKKTINHCIRIGNDFTEKELKMISDVHEVDLNLMRLWKLVKNIKEDALSVCSNDAWFTTYDDNDEIDGEGYVMWNEYGTFKLVNREKFSRLNFLSSKSWVSS
tara:strand:- start:278 stop:1195 length:918 start_codon:yes stop_codon:yes gene_type:complete